MILNNKNYGVLKLFIAMILMGTVGYFVIESHQKPHDVVFFRCLFGVIFLAPYCFFTGMFKNSNLTKKKVFILFISGIFLVCNWIMLFASFKHSSISVATTIYHVQPFLFVILWSIVHKEKIAPEKLLLMLFAFAGVLFVIDIFNDNIILDTGYLFGAGLALVAALFWAISAVLVKHVEGVKPHVTVLIQLFVGVLVISPFVDFSSIINITSVDWTYLIILGVVHSCLVYILMYSSYKTLTAPIIAIMTFIYPCVAIIVDMVAYSKILSYTQWIGILMILLSSLVSSQNIQIFRKSN
jgi:drug/metabolite transporter (DMT)-like permease